MRMVKWMRGVKLQDRIPSKGLRERLGLDDIISVLQQKSMKWRVPGQEVNQRKLGDCGKDCQACKLNRENAMDNTRWMKEIRDD